MSQPTCHHCGKPFLTHPMLVRHVLRVHHGLSSNGRHNVAKAVQKCAVAKLDAELTITRRTLALP